MRALRAHTRGGPENLQYESAPRPEPGPGEVLIEVHAAAITFAELTWDETWSHLPTIPSHEVSGVVVGLGDAVERFRVGDEVFGLIRFDRQGAAAEYVTVPAGDLALRPRNVTHPVAAAVPLAALTAWQALFDQAKVVSGEHVLVHGGAGGVGAFTVQLAVDRGARVTATGRVGDAEHVRSLGVDRFIDVQVEDFDAQNHIFDVVVDTVGGATLERSFAVLKPGGRLVTLQAPPSAELAQRHGVTATFFVVAPDRDQLATLAGMVDAGRLRVDLAGRYPLAHGREAFESGRDPDRPIGKTVLVVRP
ncbi:MAG: NADP-dependent oxidoreductase [Nakamurella sp.]